MHLIYFIYPLDLWNIHENIIHVIFSGVSTILLFLLWVYASVILPCPAMLEQPTDSTIAMMHTALILHIYLAELFLVYMNDNCQAGCCLPSRVYWVAVGLFTYNAYCCDLCSIGLICATPSYLLNKISLKLAYYNISYFSWTFISSTRL